MNELDRAFELSIEEYVKRSVPDIPDHIFSKSFEKRMKKVLLRREPIIKGRITIRKCLIYITAAIIAASMTVLSVGAVRDYFKNYFIKLFDKYSVVRSADTSITPATIEEIYVIDIPDDFVLAYEDEPDYRQLSYGREYCNDDKYISFTQYTKSEFEINVNTEGRKLNYISINGCDGYIIDLGKGEYYISWDNGDYIFDLISNIGYDEQLELAESVGKDG